MPDYIGPERRKDYIELDRALEQVEHLHSAVTTLATAVTNTVPRQELEALRHEMRRDYLIKIYFMGGFTAVIIVWMSFFMNFKIDNANQSIKHGHSVIECLMGKTEAQRTGDNAATAAVTCEQTVRP